MTMSKPFVTVEEFEDYLKYIGKRSRTVKTYVEVLKAFERFLHEHGKTLDDFTVIDAQAFVGNMNPSMANVFIPAIRKYAWLRVTKAKDLGNEDLASRELWKLYRLKEDLQYVEVPEGVVEDTLEPEEVAELIKKVSDDPLLQAAIVVHAYFGLRPVEATGFRYVWERKVVEIGLYYAKFNWDERYLQMHRAKIKKTPVRFLVWDGQITPYLKTWVKHLKDIMQLKQPHEWFTKRLKGLQLDGRQITAMTFRKTFRTQMDLRGVPDIWIKYLMGHELKISRRYQNMKVLLPILRDIMENPEKHYLLEVLGEIQ